MIFRNFRHYFLLITSSFCVFFLIISCSKYIETSQKEPTPSQINTLGSDSTLEKDVPSFQFIPNKNQTVLRSLQASLTFSNTTQELILVKEFQNGPPLTKLLINQYNTTSKKYEIAFIYDFKNIDTKISQLSLTDLTGNHEQEIIVRLFDIKGVQHFFVLQKNKTSSSSLSFSLLFSLTSEGGISVNEVQRSEAYDEFSEEGKSFQIFDDYNSFIDKELYIFHAVYSYDEKTNTYSKTSEINTKDYNNGLQKLLSFSKEDLEDYVQGIWKLDSKKKNVYVLLDIKNSVLGYYLNDEDSSEMYSITFSQKPLYNSFYLLLSNENLPSFTSSVSLTIKNKSSLILRDSQSRFDGQYSRVNKFS